MSDVKVGDAVIYTDEVYVEHNAIVTSVHTPSYINCVYVGDDDAKRDPYGRQIERASSVVNESLLTTMAKKGRCYRTA